MFLKYTNHNNSINSIIGRNERYFDNTDIPYTIRTMFIRKIGIDLGTANTIVYVPIVVLSSPLK